MTTISLWSKLYSKNLISLSEMLTHTHPSEVNRMGSPVTLFVLNKKTRHIE